MVRLRLSKKSSNGWAFSHLYRWFLGYTLQEETPHFSTVSYNFRHRFTAETVDQVFAWILEEVGQAGYLLPKAVFIDGTHIKASATTNRDGYREYKSDPKICTNCPCRELCTHSKDCVKTVQRLGSGDELGEA